MISGRNPIQRLLTIPAAHAGASLDYCAAAGVSRPARQEFCESFLNRLPSSSRSRDGMRLWQSPPSCRPTARLTEELKKPTRVREARERAAGDLLPRHVDHGADRLVSALHAATDRDFPAVAREGPHMCQDVGPRRLAVRVSHSHSLNRSRGQPHVSRSMR